MSNIRFGSQGNDDVFKTSIAAAKYIEEDKKSFALRQEWDNKRHSSINTIVATLPSSGGIFAIVFPNGMKYIGSSNNIRKRVKQYLLNLFPNMELKFKENTTKWFIACHQMMPGLSIDDLEIEYEVRSDYKQAEKKLLKDMAANDKDINSRIFNLKWL